MHSPPNFPHSTKKPTSDKRLNLSKAAKSLEIIKYISHFSPLLKTNSPNPYFSSNIVKTPALNILKELSDTRDSIISEIQESLGLKERPLRKSSFHKSKDFIEKKLKIRKNVRESKFKSSEKLNKLKSIVEFESKGDSNFLSNDDMKNEIGVKFLSLNRRHFGKSPNPVPIIKSIKKKSPYKYSVTKLNTRCPSLPDLGVSQQLKLDFSSSVKKSVDFNAFSKNSVDLNQPSKKSLDLNSSRLLKNYIHSEMKKVWPSEDQKGKFLLKLSNL